MLVVRDRRTGRSAGAETTLLVEQKTDARDELPPAATHGQRPDVGEAQRILTAGGFVGLPQTRPSPVSGGRRCLIPDAGGRGPRAGRNVDGHEEKPLT